MMRDIRIEEANGGYIIRAYEPKAGQDMYPSMDDNSVVVSTKAECKDFVDKWLEKKAPPFKKEQGE